MASSGSTLGGGAQFRTLSASEQQAAQRALAKLGAGSRSSGTLGSATAVSGSSHTTGTMSMLHGVDTFIGGVRGVSPAAGTSVGTDTVLSGSMKTAGALPTASHPLAQVAQNFSLNADTINALGATASSVKAVEPHATTSSHTVAISDKTTINIAGLSAHDISKLHH